MRPWNTKLVCQLTEAEMYDYVTHLECDDSFRRAREIDEIIERVVRNWRRRTEEGISVPCHIYHPSPMQGFVGELSAKPPGGYDVVRIYSWMTEDQVRYLAREQLMEIDEKSPED